MKLREEFTWANLGSLRKIRKSKIVEITKEEFLAFEAVRLSGVTDMGVVSVVEELSGLSREQINAIIDCHDELKHKYTEQNP